MRNFFITKFFMFLLVCSVISGVSRAEEEKQFLTEYDLLFDIQNNGETIVNQNITITNVQNDIIATSYSLTVNELSVYDIKAFADEKELSVIQNEDVPTKTTDLSINFNDYIIGEGRQNEIKITYKSKDITSKFGEVWNVHIPKTELSESTTRYNIQLRVPKVFGPKIFISPVPVSEKEEKDFFIYAFTKESLNNKGVNAAFGNYQILNFKLNYNIENPYIIPVSYEVAFPPEIRGSQQVQYTNIDPKPKKMYLDKDGNTIGLYRLNGKSKMNIELIGSSKLIGKQVDIESSGKIIDLPKRLVRDYTKEQKFWETGSQVVLGISRTLFDPNSSVTSNTQKIYNYIVSNMEYDFELIDTGEMQRKGAEKALIRKEGNACMEFTDSFVAISRAMGIPARELNGFAFTNEEVNKPLSLNLTGGDLLHAWPEYFDPILGWVQIDPTWGNTSGVDYFSKLDTNHFVFSIKGLNSEYPLPAGAYRFDGDKKLIEVVFAQNTGITEFSPKVEIKKLTNINPIQLVKNNYKYEIKNTGNIFVYTSDGKVIPPGEAGVIYQQKDLKIVNLKDFNNGDIFIDL